MVVADSPRSGGGYQDAVRMVHSEIANRGGKDGQAAPGHARPGDGSGGPSAAASPGYLAALANVDAGGNGARTSFCPILSRLTWVLRALAVSQSSPRPVRPEVSHTLCSAPALSAVHSCYLHALHGRPSKVERPDVCAEQSVGAAAMSPEATTASPSPAGRSKPPAQRMLERLNAVYESGKVMPVPFLSAATAAPLALCDRAPTAQPQRNAAPLRERDGNAELNSDSGPESSAAPAATGWTAAAQRLVSELAVQGQLAAVPQHLKAKYAQKVWRSALLLHAMRCLCLL